jgi:hypothetical protein
MSATAHLSAFQEPVWSITQAGRRWPWRVRVLARLEAPWLDLALASGADPSGSPQLERRADLRVPVDLEEVTLAGRQLVELEDLLISPGPVYCRGVVMASQIVSDGSGPLYAPERKGELPERVAGVICALRGAL